MLIKRIIGNTDDHHNSYKCNESEEESHRMGSHFYRREKTRDRRTPLMHWVNFGCKKRGNHILGVNLSFHVSTTINKVQPLFY